MAGTRRPDIYMERSTFDHIMCSIGSCPPETGGILLGPVGIHNFVSGFFFDVGATCSGATYSPDHRTLKRKLAEEWTPSGVDMKGFAHSHPASFDRLSRGDLNYIKRLLEINPDMSLFIAPIVLPRLFRMRVLTVSRDDPFTPIPARLRLT